MEYHRKSISKNSNSNYEHQKFYDHLVSDRSTIMDDDTKLVYLYQCDKNPTIENDLSEQGTNVTLSPDWENLDRRTVLCNSIMQEQCPTCQLPPYNYYDEDYGERKPVKSRYMDIYFKHLEEQGKHETGDPTEQKNPTTTDATYLNTTCKTTDPRPIKAKSRYMDYLDSEQHQGVLKKEKAVIPYQLDWKDYHRLDTIHKFLDDMQYNYPSLCTTGVIGSSIENRDIKVLKVSNSYFKNVSVWIDAGIHAREWIAPAVNTYIANYVVRNFDKLPRSMTNKDWYFLPVVNPDGYEFTHTNYRMWRKNKALVGNECIGVDLNRNFSCGWGGKGSSEEPKSPFYRGPRPFSEPESRALRATAVNKRGNMGIMATPDYIPRPRNYLIRYQNDKYLGDRALLGGQTIFQDETFLDQLLSSNYVYIPNVVKIDMLQFSGIDFKVYITLHSFGQVILFPFAYCNELCPDYIRLLEGATTMTKAIYKTSGNIYRVGISRDVMYGAAGTSCDWSYGEAKIPFCYLLELNSRKHRFRLPEVEIEETAKEILGAVMALMEFVDNFDTESAILDDSDSTINIWKEQHSTMDFFVGGPRAAQVAGLLHEKGIPYSISIKDVEALKIREQGSSVTINVENADNLQTKAGQSKQPPVRPSKMVLPGRCMNWTSYHSLGTIYGFMDKLASSYPYLCSVSVIGKSTEGRDIKLLKISNGNPDNKGVWIDAAIHAREWISVAVVTFIANELVEKFHKQPESVTNKDWYFLPVMNPDGYMYTHTDDRMWRKNRTKYGACVGVDLNRNFSYGWGEAAEDGSSDDPGSIFYRGPKPFSEPETAAVKNVILESNTEFKVFLSFHSYGEVIIFPWGYTGEPCPTYVELLEGGTAMARAIHATNGRTYKVGSTKDLMYFSSGTSVDWSYGVANIPYSYMIELPSKQHRFLLPKEQIISTGKELFNGVTDFMEFVDKRCVGTGPSNCTSVCSVQSKL